MTLRHYSTNTDAARIDRAVDAMTDGTVLIVAVEIFDAPTSRYSETHDATIGPWVVGPADEVYAWLKEQSYEDHCEQYSAGGAGQDEQ